MAKVWEMYPQGVGVGVIGAQTPNTSSGDLVGVRSSVATRINEDRVIVEEPINKARVDYLDGNCPSILLEPQRENLVITSNSGVYGGSLPSSEANTISPFNDNTAFIPTPSNEAGRYEYIVTGGTFITGTKLTYSWYRKRISTPTGIDITGDLNIKALVNLTGLEVDNARQIESDINGYDRFEAVVEIVDGALDSTLRAYYGEVVQTGNSSVAYWGHQLEEGDYSTSIIRTSGSTVIRAMDDDFNTGDLTSVINSEEGVIQADIKSLVSFDGNREISISDGTNNNAVSLRYTSVDNQIQSVFEKSGEGAVSVQFVVPNVKEYNTVKVLFNQTELKLKIDDTEVDTTTIVGFAASTLNTVNLHRGGVGRNFYGRIRSVKLYNSSTNY